MTQSQLWKDFSMIKISDTPTIHEQAYEHIRHMIMSGKIAVGQKIVENDLVKRLGTSRGPIRESLMLLQKWKKINKEMIGSAQ